jgi:hypothetical protein
VSPVQESLVFNNLEQRRKAMPTICIHCALEALVKSQGRKVGGGAFDESPQEHMQRVHPNGIPHEERIRLEHEAAKILGMPDVPDDPRD